MGLIYRGHSLEFPRMISNHRKEKFNIGAKKVPCRIRIEAIDGFTYTYKLFVKEKGNVFLIFSGSGEGLGLLMCLDAVW